MRRFGWAAFLFLCAMSSVVTTERRAAALLPQTREAFAGVLDEHPAIQYATRPASDRVAVLNQAIARGSTTLTYREPAGYLLSLLEGLEISPESQLLVFSKTGLQRTHTGPLNPRALYFNDSVVVGYIPGARFLEIAAHEPDQGVHF